MQIRKRGRPKGSGKKQRETTCVNELKELQYAMNALIDGEPLNEKIKEMKFARDLQRSSDVLEEKLFPLLIHGNVQQHHQMLHQHSDKPAFIKKSLKMEEQ